MSEDLTLSQRTQHAIQAHLQTIGGGFPTEFLLVANYIDADGDSSFFLACAPDQNVSTSLGLLRWGTIAVEADAVRYFNDEEDE